jgi:hypothetical protein
MKDAYYFQHDSNAQNDPKLLMVLEQLGCEGIGIYWMLLEVLREQDGYRYPLAAVSALARRWYTSKEKVLSVITQYSLFTVHGEEFFFSESFCRRMEYIDNRRRVLSEAGKRGNATKWHKALPEAHSSPPDHEATATRSQPDRSIGKDSIVKDSIKKDKKEKKEYAPSLHLSDDEFEKLKTEHPDIYQEAIQQVSLHKQMTGKKYKSDYAAILKWGLSAAVTNKTANNGTKPAIDFDEVARRINGNGSGK